MQRDRPVISSWLLLLMAVAVGAIVANLYYAQPLLHLIGKSFAVSTAAVTSVITATQAGYALGLGLVVPIGDLRPRRSLIPVIYLIAAVGLIACALAPSLAFFTIASVFVGCSSVGGQLLIPFTADFVAPERRARSVARVMTGLLVGILLARTVAGYEAQLFGWRTVYWSSAVLMVAFALILANALPHEPARPHTPYVSLVHSSLRLLIDEPVLRIRAIHGGLCFASFSALWAALTWLLSGSPYHYNAGVIGLFGIVGLAGVFAANVAGRYADRSRQRRLTVGAAVIIVSGFVVLLAGTLSIWAVVAGITLVDLGGTTMQITNQSVIYALVPEARSRLTSAYMVCYFIGGATGSALAGICLATGHWWLVCVTGAVLATGSLILTALTWSTRGAFGATPLPKGEPVPT